MAIIEVGRAEAIPPGSAMRIEVGELPIAIFNQDGTFLAIGDTCSHEDYSLADGEVGDDCAVECALHGARFDLRTGAALSLPAVRSVGSFAVWVEDGIIKLELPDAHADSVA